LRDEAIVFTPSKAETRDPLPEQKEVTPMDLKDETLDPIGDTVEQ